MRVPRVTKRMSELSFYRRTTNVGQSIPSAIITIVDFEDEYKSEGNALTYQAGAGYTAATGVWTTPPRWIASRKCKLQVSTSIRYAGLNASNEHVDFYISKNSSLYTQLGTSVTVGQYYSPGTLSDTIELEKDEYFDIRTYQGTGGAVSFQDGPLGNYITIHEQPDSQPVDA